MLLLTRVVWIFSLVVVVAVAASAGRARAEALPCALGDEDCFLDGAGRTRRAARAYEQLHLRAETNHLRALAEEVLFLGVGTTWYWLAREQNLLDWDFPSAKQRFTLGVMRFDNNAFPVNFVFHPLSGAAYYATARHNGASFGVSALYALGTTIAWEYGIEFREKVSINDFLFTPLPGVALGEFYSRLALYLNRPAGRASRWQRALGWLLGPLRALHDTWDGVVESDPDTAPDALGYAADVSHQFTLRAGVAAQNLRAQSAWMGEFCAEGRFVAIPSYRRVGNARHLLVDGDVSRLSLCTRHGAGGWEFDLYNDTLLLGFYEQRISPAGWGGSFLVGSSLAWRYRRVRFAEFHDDLAVSHLPGLALEGEWVAPGAVLWLSTRAHPDFAGVHAASHAAWKAVHPDAIEKTVLEREQYVYSFGASLLVELGLQVHQLHTGMRLWLAYFNTKEGLDRDQENLTRDVRGDDQLLDLEGFVRFFPWRERGWLLELALMSRTHRSRLSAFVTTQRLTRGALRVGLAF